MNKEKRLTEELASLRVLVSPAAEQAMRDLKADNAALRSERDRWREDSLRQTATIQRLADAATDRDEVDRLRHVAHQADLAKAEDDNAALRLEIDSMRSSDWHKDAERYRWLRDTGWSEELETIISQHRNAQFDDAIDAAMLAGKEKEKTE